MNDENIIKIAKLEAKFENIEEDVSRLKDDNILLHKMTVNQETLLNIVKENQDQMKEFSTTLSDININLSTLNSTSSEMRTDLNGFKNDLSKFETELVNVKDGNAKANDRGKFDWVEFISKDFFKWLLLALAGVIFGYFFGTK